MSIMPWGERLELDKKHRLFISKSDLESNVISIAIFEFTPVRAVSEEEFLEECRKSGSQPPPGDWYFYEVVGARLSGGKDVLSRDKDEAHVSGARRSEAST